jgi:hypothetical protein
MINRRKLGGAVTVIALIPTSVSAQGWGDAFALDPPQWQFGNTEIRLGGFAGGALFASSQEGGPGFPGGYERNGASALATSNVRVQRTFDTGLVLGARADFLLYRDRLSADNYDSDTVQRLFLFVQTGFGRVEIGQMDGTAHTLGLTGPIVDQQVTLENRNISLFRDPTTGEDFGALFQQTTTVQNSSNYAKINYVSPRLFGVQIGASFTPQTVRTPLPFTGNPSDDANRQNQIWELAASYTGFFSSVAVGVTGGLAHGRLKNRTDEGDGLLDWAVGTQIAYTMDDTKISFGGAYRGSNAYLLDIEQVRGDSRARLVQLSATLEKPVWLAGVEFTNGDIEGPFGLTVTGFQVSAGYRINANMQVTVGWQHYDYSRNAGAFYNGLSEISMNAAFLSLGYSL